MRLIIVTSFALLLSGCVGPAAPPTDEGPATLLATSSFMSHSGSGSVSAVPEHDIAMPDRCTLFREDGRSEGTTCAVRPGPADNIEAPWHVSAAFSSSIYPLDDPRRWSEKTIEAYDAEGQIVAVWDGAKDYHEEHSRAIE